MEYLTSKYGEPEVLEDDFFWKVFIYYWNIEDSIITIGSIYDHKENAVQIRINETKEKEELEHVENPKIVTKLFIVNKKYRDLIKEELKNRSGDWFYLKYN